MSDDFDDPKTALTKRLQRPRSTEDSPVNDPCSTSKGMMRAGDVFDSTGLGYKSTVDMFSASTGTIKIGDMLGSTGVIFNSATDPYSAFTGRTSISDMFDSTGLGYKSTVDMFSASTGTTTVRDTLVGTSVIFKSTADPYSTLTGRTSVADMLGSEGLGYKSTADMFSASTGTITVRDTLRGTSVIFKSAADPYSTLTGRTSVTDMLGSEGLGYKSLGDMFASSNEQYLLSSRTNVLTTARPLSLGPAVDYYSPTILSRPITAANAGVYRHVEPQIKQQQFGVKFTLQFNDGKDVPAEWLEEAKLELTDLFGGVSYVKGGGLWKHEGVVFRNTWIWIIVEAPDLDRNIQLMKQFKERWRLRLGQIDLRVTSQEVKIL